jgi:ubiquinol-cytochrome c reductase cytochrome b subunit
MNTETEKSYSSMSAETEGNEPSAKSKKLSAFAFYLSPFDFKTRLSSFDFADEPSEGLSAWSRTTAGVVAMLLTLQFVTGVLLAFYYVPSIESAHTTVAYIEKVVPAGSWLRALHHYGSVLVPLSLLLHLVQMFWRGAYRRKPVAWLSCVVLLALVMSASGTGYSLPYDLSAFFSARVAEGIAGGLPLVGGPARKFVLGGEDISALTLTRFFALHVFVIAGLILFTLVTRFFIFRERENGQDDQNAFILWRRKQLARNAIVVSIVFLALSFWAMKNPAPFGPAAGENVAGYLPRPGPQFLWLFETLKHLPGQLTSIFAAVLPGVFFGALATLPFLDSTPLSKLISQPSRKVGAALFVPCILLIALMTALAIISDRRDEKTREQLARQKADEAAWRNQPFEPLRLGGPIKEEKKQRQNTNTSTGAEPTRPQAYITYCASCHGSQGRGKSVFPSLIGLSAKPRRAVEDLIAIMNNPTAYNLKPPMKSFVDKLNEEEKRAIAIWLLSLKKE